MPPHKITAFYPKYAPTDRISLRELDASDDKKFFQCVGVPEKLKGIPRCELGVFKAHYNKWSLSNMFRFQGQRYLIPTLFANLDAWMFEWEIKQDVYRQPTKAWLGKYCVWYKGGKGFFLCKLKASEPGDAGPVLYGNAKLPGPQEKDWFEEEMESIWQSIKTIDISNPGERPNGTAKPPSD